MCQLQKCEIPVQKVLFDLHNIFQWGYLSIWQPFFSLQNKVNFFPIEDVFAWVTIDDVCSVNIHIHILFNIN